MANTKKYCTDCVCVIIFTLSGCVSLTYVLKKANMFKCGSHRIDLGRFWFLPGRKCFQQGKGKPRWKRFLPLPTPGQRYHVTQHTKKIKLCQETREESSRTWFKEPGSKMRHTFSHAVAGGDAGVLSQRQSGAGGLQDGHEDGPQRNERAGQTQAHSRDPRTGEKHKRRAGFCINISCTFLLFV